MKPGEENLPEYAEKPLNGCVEQCREFNTREGDCDGFRWKEEQYIDGCKYGHPPPCFKATRQPTLDDFNDI